MVKKLFILKLAERIPDMLYGTRELAKKWGVSSETVRRYLKKQGKSKDYGGTFFINDKELENIEAFLNNTRCKVANDFDDSRWKIKKISKKAFRIIDASIKGNKILMELSDDSETLWKAFFYCKNRQKGEEIAEKLIKIGKLIVDGIENKSTGRLVLKKIQGFKKTQKKSLEKLQT